MSNVATKKPSPTSGLRSATASPLEELGKALSKLHSQNKSKKFIAKLLVIEADSQMSETYRNAFTVPTSLSAIPLRAQMPSQYSVEWLRSSEMALALVKNSRAQENPVCVVFLEDIELMRSLLYEDPLLVAVLLTENETCDFNFIQTYLGPELTGRWDYLSKSSTAEQLQHRLVLAVANWKIRCEMQLRNQEIASLQEKMLETDKLASIATVARGVGHEFGNILTQILAKAEISRQKPDGEVRENLESIVKASLRARDVLNRFRFLSGSTSEEPAEHKWMFLNEPLDEAIELMNYHLESQQVKICRVKSKKIPVYANATSLMQVFLNLLINAVSAMGSGGQIDISIGELAGNAQNAEGWGEIRVHDYGPGVDQKILPQLTTPFFTTKGVHGSGLGLSIVRDIIEKEHSGNLILRNHESKGFEVIIQLPLEPAATIEAQSPEVAEIIKLIPEKMRS
jgi:signal transduction histidine kinase